MHVFNVKKQYYYNISYHTIQYYFCRQEILNYDLSIRINLQINSLSECLHYANIARSQFFFVINLYRHTNKNGSVKLN